MNFDAFPFPFQLSRRSSQKYLRIRISRKGEVHVSAPASMPEYQIREALLSRQAWVEKHLSAFRRLHEEMDPLVTIPLNGIPYTVEMVPLPEGKRGRAEFMEESRICRIRVPGGSESAARALLERELRKIAAGHLGARTQEISRKIRIPYEKLFIRNQHTRWGSSSGRGNLSLNWRVILLDPACQDYLIIHELCHQKHFNHSPAYWKTVEKYCPDYRLLNRRLTEQRELMSLFR